MVKVKNTSTSHILLTADGHPAIAIPPTGRARGRIDDGPSLEFVPLSDEQIEIYGATMVDAGAKDGAVSQLDYFSQRGLVFL